MLKLRYWLLGIFGFLTILPVVVLATWVAQNSYEREFSEVEDRHLLLAHNIGKALSVYQRDVKSMFHLIVNGSNAWDNLDGVEDVLRSMSFRHICIADMSTGSVFRQSSPKEFPCPEFVPEKRFEIFKNLAVEGETVFSPVMAGPDDSNIIFLIRKVGSQLAIGALNTDYIVALGKSVTFGEMGHAAIVDHEGNVLSHPLDSWIAERKNIRKVSAVQRMLNGETGIETFYSPALKGDMIAGLTSVPGVGWGVMIPQPVAELEAKIAAEQRVALLIVVVSLCITILISLVLGRQLVLPLERLIAAADLASRNRAPQDMKIVRGFFTPLEHIKVQLAYNQMVRSMRVGQREMRKLAYQDSLTGLANRTAFNRSVHDQLDLLGKPLADRGVTSALSNDSEYYTASLIYVDLDSFKGVNDTMGHHVGDEVLRQIAQRLRHVMASIYVSHKDMYANKHELDHHLTKPLISRIGGDEFTIFLPQLGKQLPLETIVAQIIEAIAAPMTALSEPIVVEASVGVACFPKDGRTLDELTKKADIAMYHAKSRGKNCYQLYHSEIGELTKAEICRDVIAGIQAGEFELHFQPKLDGCDESVAGCEALVRWNDPRRGMVRPDLFIPAIERHEATVNLGEFVVRNAMANARQWQAHGINMKIAVNISTYHFLSEGFVDRMVALAFEEDVHPSMIELEITEESILDNEELGNRTIIALRDLGFKIALDDFGRGYSNLTRLTKLDFDVLKIDGPLVRDSVLDKRARIVVEATLNMARGLGCCVVAEGVETTEEVALMRELGCDYLQGYYYAKPMPEAEFIAWAQAHATQRHEKLNLA